MGILTPTPRLSVAEWADRFRYLSPEASARPGKYRTAFAPYQREPMESILDPDSSMTVLMFASQLGKSEMLNNAIGYFVHWDPSPILIVQPTVDLAESYSKERIAPMIRDCPVLKPLIKDAKSRDSGNTIDMKQFPGGSLALVGANAPGGLAGRPRRVVLLDEVDRYPISAGTEGDPTLLAIRRTESFWNAVVVMTSTPTVKGSSRIEEAFEDTDQRRWFVPCPKCEHRQTLKWSGVVWPKGQPELAHYVCEKCNAEWSDDERRAAVMGGEWRPTAEGVRHKRGYHLNGLASVFPAKPGFRSRLHQAASEFLEAKRGGSHLLRTWVNTFLAETWEEEGSTIQPDPLYARREEYGPAVPNQVLVLTAGVDVQDDWIEAEIVGWGLDEESWGVDRLRIAGSPSIPSTWAALDKWLLQTRQREDGTAMQVGCCLVDSGAHTKTVYAWTKPRQMRGVYACKGVAGSGRPIVSPFSRSNIGRAMLFPVGVDTAKELIYSRLQIQEFGPGFMHFPMTYDAEYFQQLTAEKKVIHMVRGVRRMDWQKIRPRNEALDCRVYATAALSARRFDLPRLAKHFEEKAQVGPVAKPKDYQLEDRQQMPVKAEVAQEIKSQIRRARPRGSAFVQSWRKW